MLELYRETTGPQRVVLFAGLYSFVVSVAMAFVILFTQLLQLPLWAKVWIIAGLILSDLFYFLIVCGLQIVVLPTALVVRRRPFGWPRWVIDATRIASYSVVDLPPPGSPQRTRPAPGAPRYLAATTARGVEVRQVDGRPTYIIGSRDPEAICAALQTATGIHADRATEPGGDW
jgi:hypothetical protein